MTRVPDSNLVLTGQISLKPAAAQADGDTSRPQDGKTLPRHALLTISVATLVA